MSDFVTLSCPSCGGKLNVQKNSLAYICEYCGTEHKLREEDVESFGRCPKCHRNDRVEKITAIVNRHDQLAQKFLTPESLSIDKILDRPDIAIQRKLNSLEFSSTPERILENVPNDSFEKKSKRYFLAMTVLICLAFIFMFMWRKNVIGLLLLSLLSLLGSLILAIFGVMNSIKGAREKMKFTKMNEEKLLQEYFYRKSVLEKEYRTQKRNVMNQKAIISRKIKIRFDQMYYCHRDDLLFIPGETGSASCNDYERYLTQGLKTNKKTG